MSKKKIVLFSPRSGPGFSIRGEVLSLLAASRFLDAEGYAIKIIQSERGYLYSRAILQELKDACLLGITCMTGHAIKEGLMISKMVKSEFPNLPVVWGGWHPSILPEQTLRNPNIDICVIGQGERTLLEIVQTLEQGGDLSSIQGIAYKANSDVIVNSPRLLEDINNFPPLPFHLIDATKNIFCTDYGQRVIKYYSSQGCPYQCSFCVEPKVYRRKWYGLLGRRVAEDIERLVHLFNIDAVIFVDSNFFVSEERVQDICCHLLQKGIKIRWGEVNGYVGQLINYKKETWELLQQAGIYSILVGAESGVQEILDLLNKKIKLEQMFELINIFNTYKIKPILSFMIGLPKTDISLEQEYKNTIVMVEKIFSISTVAPEVLIFSYTPYPGTVLYQESIKKGFQPPKYLEGWQKIELNKKTTPWVPTSYVRKTDILTHHIFKWIGNDYTNRFYDKPVLLRLLLKKLELLMRGLCWWRWKHKNFFFPLDYWLVKLYFRLVGK